MKITAYLRVSTDKQAEHGHGLPVQHAACQAWAKANGHRIVAWRQDEGLSGGDGLDVREALAEAIVDVQSNASGGIVVYRLDRLARDLIVQETLIAEIRRSGDVFSTSASEAAFLVDDPKDPSRKMIRQILGAVNEYERAMIVLRMKSGRAAKAAKGGFAYGAPPFGYASASGHLVPIAAEQAIIDRMRELHAGGASLRSIATTLDNEAMPPRRGDSWSAMSVSKILARPEQIGAR